MAGAYNGCVKGSQTSYVPDLEPNVIGTYDTTVLTKLDYTLSLLHAKGIKAIISPHDSNVIGGANGCDVYCKKYGNQGTFYGSSTARQQYNARLSTIFNVKSPNFSNRPWSQLSGVIMAFDIQNEPFIDAVDKLKNNDPDDWICGTAGYMKPVIGGSGIKIATGGIGGSQYCCDHEYNVLSKALYCDAIDIISVHGYMSKASDWAYFITGDKSILKTVESTGKTPTKHVMIEEWGVASSYQDGFAAQVKVLDDAGVPWVSRIPTTAGDRMLTVLQMYWQVVPGLDQTQSGYSQNCGYDGFEIGLNSGKGNVASAVQAARAKSAAQDWTGYVN